MLYFLLLGGALFALFQLVSDESFSDPEQREEIVVSEGRINALLQRFEKTWRRPPTRVELDGLIQNFVREEVMYREALALGLDRDDPVVRRRLRQKLEFISEALAALEEPGDEELQAFLDANAESYRQPSRFSFRQVFINSPESSQKAKTEALELLAALRSDRINAAEAGDAHILQHQFVNQSDWEIERTMGRRFLQGLEEIQTGNWQGPIVSGFGLHLVYISESIEGDISRLGEVRDQVFRDWSARKRKQFNEAFYEKLRERYKVTIETPVSESTHNATPEKDSG